MKRCNYNLNIGSHEPSSPLPEDKITPLPDAFELQHSNSSKSDVPGKKDGRTDQKKRTISYFQLFRYSTRTEQLLIIFGVLVAIVSSFSMPCLMVIYGEFTSLLIDRSVMEGTSSTTYLLQLFGGGRKLTDATKEENRQALKDDSMAFMLASFAFGLGQLIALAIAVDIFNRMALRQIARVRKHFLGSMLRQDMSWYDKSANNNFASKMTEDLDKMKEGMGEKVAIFIYLLSTFVTGFVVSVVYGWKLTLVIFTSCPFIILSTALVAIIQGKLSERELRVYALAGSVSEEVFSSIRTVFAFSGENKESQRFSNLLVPAENTCRRKGLYSGISTGAMWLIMYVSYAIAMFYGVTLILEDRQIENGHYTPGVVIIVLFCLMVGAQNLGFSLPHVEAFATATGAAQNVFSIIERRSEIDAMDEKGEKLKHVEGSITFEDIYFRYPTRLDVEILKGFTLEVKAGQTVAFVGASGCGKSTALQLMQRFYDPLAGSVKLDGHDLRELNVGWMRAQIGVVGQEPVLFATTIAENIRYGQPTATQEDIETAARMANCHDFITKLPHGYDTQVGERGAQMSGGQKQRIAIARALISNPKILLLDEATSALDPTSEKRVQDALDLASKGRTTLVVSHRLSTVTNADKIVFVKDGVVVEEGTHDELMEREGFYAQLVNINKRKEATEEGSYAVVPAEQIKKRKAAAAKRLIDEETSESSDSDDTEEANKLKDEKGVKKKKKKVPQESKVSFSQVLKLNAPEWRYLLIGCIASVMHGATFPVSSVFLGDFFAIMASNDEGFIRQKSDMLAYIFIAIGVVAAVGSMFQVYMFTWAGAKMTTRLREITFKTIIRQEVAFFDDVKNSVGALCARLAGDCASVQGATGSRIGIVVQAVSTLLIGVFIGFYFSWNLTLLTLVLVPCVVLTIMFESRYMEASALAEKVAIESASQVAVEAIANIRTVTSLGQEPHVQQRYCSQLDLVDEACIKKLRFRGTVFGLGQSSPYIAYGISLYYGGLLVADDSIPYADVIKTSEALIFGSWMLGQALAYAPNATAAFLSARRLIKLFQRTPTMHNPVDSPYTAAQKLEGDITYENVNFHYPNRQDIPILRNFNLNIESGSTVALVGPSGSGKSTCVQLLLRYYDPVQGAVCLSNVKTTAFSFDGLRSRMGLVSQEPTLFDRTIAENIAYGDNARENIPMAEIIAAAKKSNIHNFITALPQGYNTSLGTKGAQLSGGQKQRIAIARALIRNPKILVLDEATSALDMESEKVVQEALDAARHGRTCITIAHRLTTIRDADLICVLKNGVIIEQGTHDGLMAQGGMYSELYLMQQVS